MLSCVKFPLCGWYVRRRVTPQHKTRHKKCTKQWPHQNKWDVAISAGMRVLGPRECRCTLQVRVCKHVGLTTWERMAACTAAEAAPCPSASALHIRRVGNAGNRAVLAVRTVASGANRRLHRHTAVAPARTTDIAANKQFEIRSCTRDDRNPIRIQEIFF